MSEFHQTGRVNSTEVIADHSLASEQRAHLYEVLTVFRLSMVFVIVEISMAMKNSSNFVSFLAIAGLIAAIWFARSMLGQNSKPYFWGKFIFLAVCFWPALVIGLVLHGFVRVASFARQAFGDEIDHRDQQRRFYRNVNDRMEGR